MNIDDTGVYASLAFYTAGKGKRFQLKTKSNMQFFYNFAILSELVLAYSVH